MSTFFFFFFFRGYLILWNVQKFTKFAKVAGKKFSPKAENIKQLKIA